MGNTKIRCAFAGHGDISETIAQRLIETIKSQAKELIVKHGVEEFLVGNYGKFDRYATKAVRELKTEYNVELVLVIPYLTKPIEEYKKDYSETFDAVIIADIPEKTPKNLKIIKTNQYMVDKSDYLICYVERSFGGAAKTLEYAEKKHKQIYNLNNSFTN